MPSSHDNGWSPLWVILNTFFTAVGGVAGVAALIISVIAITR